MVWYLYFVMMRMGLLLIPYVFQNPEAKVSYNEINFLLESKQRSGKYIMLPFIY